MPPRQAGSNKIDFMGMNCPLGPQSPFVVGDRWRDTSADLIWGDAARTLGRGRGRSDVLSRRAEGRRRSIPVVADRPMVWTVEAESHFEAMTRYYRHMGWGVHTTDYPEADNQTYAERGWE